MKLGNMAWYSSFQSCMSLICPVLSVDLDRRVELSWGGVHYVCIVLLRSFNQHAVVEGSSDRIVINQHKGYFLRRAIFN